MPIKFKIPPRIDVEKNMVVVEPDGELVDFRFVEINAGNKLRFAYQSPGSQWRVKSLFYKEPETLAWIDSLPEGDHFIDVGANVGLYSVYAAVMRKMKVTSFEPESQNYADLNKNIYINLLSDTVRAYPIGISRQSGLTVLHLTGFCTGGSFSDLGAADKRPYVYTQGSMGISLDDFFQSGAASGPPDHLKIDVDGIEADVIGGAEKLIKARAFKTIQIEAAEHKDKTYEAIEFMLASGYMACQDQLRLRREGLRDAAKVIHEFNRREYIGNVLLAREDSYFDFARDFCTRFADPIFQAEE
jgi:FkbM family methyltransferase